MNLVVMLLVCGFAVLLQMLLPALTWAGQARLLFPVSVSLYYGLNRETHIALMAAFLAGVMHDVLSPVPLGFSTILLLLMVWLVGRIRHLLLPEAVVTAAVFGALGGLFFTAGLHLLLLQSAEARWPWRMVWIKAAAQAGLLAFITPWVCIGCRRLEAWVGNIELRERFSAPE